jgi:DNA-nicking Smr family endonuclease
MPELRPLVLGFEEALPQHGGSGALYVRLRRARGPQRSAGRLE